MTGDNEIVLVASTLETLQADVERTTDFAGRRWPGPTMRDLDNRLLSLRDLTQTLRNSIQAAEANLALGATLAASSVYPGYPVENAADGDTGTYWSSDFADDQWLIVDLGAPHWLAWARVRWEAAYPLRWDLDLEVSAGTWVTCFSNPACVGGDEEVILGADWPACSRFRIHAYERATIWGIAISEVELYGEKL